MKAILQKITAQTSLEAQWLNTLSLLEFIGARKIAKTVARQHPSLEILEHYADETRHAHAFKRLSQHLSDDESFLCRDEAVAYFQTLDQQMADWLQDKFPPADPYPNYLLTTSLIERRAMQLYPLYRDTSSQALVRAELELIIQEESNHRPEIDRRLKQLLREQGQGGLEDCWQIEEQLFATFTEALRAGI